MIIRKCIHIKYFSVALLVVQKKRTRQNVRRTKQFADPVDRTKMTMGELIYMNPAANPMKLVVNLVAHLKCSW